MGFSFFATDLLLKIRSELVEEFANHTERNRNPYPRECGAHAAIVSRIIGV
jgi:hypothetical protein